MARRSGRSPATGVRNVPPLARSSASMRALSSARSVPVWVAGMAATRSATRLARERCVRLGWRPSALPVIGSAHIPSRLNRCCSVTCEPVLDPAAVVEAAQACAQEHAGRGPRRCVVAGQVGGVTRGAVTDRDRLHQVAIARPQSHPA